VLFEMGRFRESAALFDSVSRRHSFESASRDARIRSWAGTLAATARAAAGDTAGFETLADSIQVWGSRSGYGRDQKLHHHIRGLLLAARGRPEEALAEYRLSLFSPVIGYSRTNIEMAKAYLALNRPAEAVAILESAMRGPYDGASTYAVPAELWEWTATANEAAGRREDAVRYYRKLLSVWKRADPEFQPRIARAHERIAALTGNASR
jgi:tetratricopeptide (TPR) repeat protein